MVKIYPLSGNGKPIFYENKDYNLIIKWGNQKIKILIDIINDIMKNYFLDFKTWYPLGASMTCPLKGGLGEYLNKNYPKLNPKHADVIGRITIQQLAKAIDESGRHQDWINEFKLKYGIK